MSTWKINLKEQTATSINGITFKLTETKPGEFMGQKRATHQQIMAVFHN